MSRSTGDAIPINTYERSDAPSHVQVSRPAVVPFPVIGQPVRQEQSFVASATSSSDEPWYSRSPKAFTVSGIDVHVSPLLIIYVAFVIAMGSFDGLYHFGLSLFYCVVLFGTVLVHELGHCWATRNVGGVVSHILLWPLGGLAYINLDASSAKGDLWVAAAGPLTHIPMGLIWLMLSAITSGFVKDLAWEALWINVYLFAFNLLIPAYPMDASRILTSTLAICGVSVSAASIVVIGLSMIMSTALLVYGFWLVQLLPVFVGSYTMAETYKIYALLRAGQIHHPPSFAKYEQRSGASVGV